MRNLILALILAITLSSLIRDLRSWKQSSGRGSFRTTPGLLDILREWLLMIPGLGFLKRLMRVKTDRESFLEHAFSMLALMAKADGRVSTIEISHLELYMRDVLRLDEKQRQTAINAFRSALRSKLDFDHYAIEFYRRFRTKSGVLYGMASVLTELAKADGELTRQEEMLLERVLFIFGITRFNFSSNSNEQRSNATETSNNDLSDAYRMLECAPGAPLDEVKRAYRRLVKEHHPDRVLARGLPPEFTRHAEERFRQVQAAYEKIMEGA